MSLATKYAEAFKRLPTWVYKSAGQAWIDYKFPRHIFIETTAACNLSCEYCPREKIKNHMDWDLFTKIVDEATCFGPRSFSLHLFGEPLLYPHIFRGIEYIKRKNKRHTVLLTSNGTLFERYINEIVWSDIDKLIWSWRPEARFSKETKEALRQWGRLTVRMIKGVNQEEATKEWEDWPNLEVREVHNYGGNIETGRWQKSTGPKTRWPCYHLWLAPGIGWNGKFLMCCSDPHQKEIFGDINHETISECWNRLNGVRKAHLRGEYEGICKDCDVWKAYPDLFFDFQKRS